MISIRFFLSPEVRSPAAVSRPQSRTSSRPVSDAGESASRPQSRTSSRPASDAGNESVLSKIQ